MISAASAIFFSLASSQPAHLHFRGEINARTVAEFARDIPSKADVLVIESAGGEENSALDLAEMIRARGLRVRVDTYCLSACALYILPAATMTDVGKDALIGFHQSALGTAQLMLRVAPSSPKTKEIDAVARRAVRFYIGGCPSSEVLGQPGCGFSGGLASSGLEI